MAELVCPGNCNSSYRRAHDAFKAALAAHGEALADLKPGDPVPLRPEPPEIRPWLGDPTWCGKCKSRIRLQLAELDDLAALLAATEAGLRGGSGDGDRVSGTRVHPSPSGVVDDLDELEIMLTGWEGAYREVQGWPSPPRRGYLASVISSCTAWLGLHLDGVLACDFAEDFGREVGTWHREIARKARAGSGTHHKPVRCPRCRMMLLTWREGDEYVSCGNPDCGRMLSLDEYQEHASTAAREVAA